jgi:hypothetical protein
MFGTLNSNALCPAAAALLLRMHWDCKLLPSFLGNVWHPKQQCTLPCCCCFAAAAAGPGTGLGAAQLFWDSGIAGYKVGKQHVTKLTQMSICT